MGFTDELKEKIDIASYIGQSITLKRSGSAGRHVGLCPFHGENTPSFHVYTDNQTYKCYGCGEAGDIYSYIQKTENIDFKAALHHLAEILGEDVPSFTKEKGKETSEKEKLFALTTRAVEYYHKTLLSEKYGNTALEYLENRGITREQIKKYKIGYAPDPSVYGWQYLYDRLSVQEQDLAVKVGLVSSKNSKIYDYFRNRIMLPVKDTAGRYCGFTARDLGDSGPKYLNSPETPIFNKSRTLFGFSEHKASMRLHQRILFVEGGFDVISITNQNIDYSCAPLGTSITESQINILKNTAQTATLILFFDGDTAGVKALIRVAPMLLRKNLTAQVVSTPRNHDPDSFLREHGKAAFEELIKNAIPVMEFLSKKLLLTVDGTITTEQRLLDTIGELLDSIPSPTLKQSMVVHLSKQLCVDYKVLAQEFKVEYKEAIALPKDALTVTQPQYARRIAAFLLYAPEYIESAEKDGLSRFCTDEFTIAVYEGCGDGHIQLKSDKRWSEQVKRILHPDSIDAKIILKNTVAGEYSNILKWTKRVEKHEQKIVQAMEYQEKLEDGVLP